MAENDGADQEEDGAADPRPQRVGAGSTNSSDEDDHDEDAERAELPAEVRRGALLDGRGDLLHLRRALPAASTPGAARRR